MTRTLQRVSSALLGLTLLFTLSAPAQAARSSERSAAQALCRLGILQGVIPGRVDDASMALDRPATRTEGLVMFLRLLGREGAATAAGSPHPFSDVPGWAGPYVGYAFQNGLTKGAGGGLFQAGRVITLTEYTTLLLRATGYDESAGDFSWQSALEKGQALGLYSTPFIARCQSGMTRGQMAEVSFAALALPCKGGSETLAGMLVRLGAADQSTLASLNLPLQPVDGTTRSIQEVVRLVNQARADQGLSPLVLDLSLNACAKVRAEELVRKFSHTRSSGAACFTVLSEQGVSYRTAGENIAYGYSSAQTVVDAWMASPGHKANILGQGYTRIGVGVVGDRWVQIFTG